MYCDQSLAPVEEVKVIVAVEPPETTFVAKGTHASPSVRTPSTMYAGASVLVVVVIMPPHI
jgi:hypothetical protein